MIVAVSMRLDIRLRGLKVIELHVGKLDILTSRTSPTSQEYHSKNYESETRAAIL